jgi:hypothetical protein
MQMISLMFSVNGHEFTIHPAFSAPTGVYPERSERPSPQSFFSIEGESPWKSLLTGFMHDFSLPSM